MPVYTVKKISTATRMKASAILEASPMPSQMTNSGARITRGMALSSVITGSSSSATSGTSAPTMPSTMPDHDAEHETAERGREGRFEMRPDAAVGEQLVERAADRLGVGMNSGLSMPARPAASQIGEQDAERDRAAAARQFK